MYISPTARAYPQAAQATECVKGPASWAASTPCVTFTFYDSKSQHGYFNNLS